jgi:hypothetical protein
MCSSLVTRFGAVANEGVALVAKAASNFLIRFSATYIGRKSLQVFVHTIFPRSLLLALI